VIAFVLAGGLITPAMWPLPAEREGNFAAEQPGVA